MDQRIREQLGQRQRIDITTIGRRSGKPHRIEIGFQQIDGKVYLSGFPGRRDWYANLVANPSFVFHLKENLVADLPAQARPIIDPTERRDILTTFTANWNYADKLDAWLAESPLVEVVFEDA